MGYLNPTVEPDWYCANSVYTCLEQLDIFRKSVDISGWMIPTQPARGSMFNILFVDTETTGLPRNWRAPASDLLNWPRMVQIAWQQWDSTGNEIASEDYLIKPGGYIIPRDATRIHGITTERALAEGHDLTSVLEQFSEVVASSSYLVAHNLSFDEKIIAAEIIRTRVDCSLSRLVKVCTMERSTDYCKLPGKFGYKRPTLSELHRRLFQQDLVGAHNAAFDLSATVRCFWELVRLGLIELKPFRARRPQPERVL